MANDMMIAALNSQRAGKMEAPKSAEPEKPEGIEERLAELEKLYDQLCEFVGMNDKKEAPKETARGY